MFSPRRDTGSHSSVLLATQGLRADAALKCQFYISPAAQPDRKMEAL